jgi:hypothetical protein
MKEPVQPANDAGPTMSPHPDPLPAEGRGQTTDDPEILALLDFEPVPRRPSQVAGWTPELQRKLILRLAEHGSIGRACNELEKDRGGASKLYNSAKGESFRAAWDGAVALFKRREEEGLAQAPRPRRRPPTVDLRVKRRVQPAEGLPDDPSTGSGQYEDAESHARRAEEAADSIGQKLVRCRRAFLAEISGSAGKRAAFEILTELPVDWKKAKTMEPQPFEPWRRPGMREPDMVLTAENGWLSGLVPYGPAKVAGIRRAIDAHRAAEGLAPVDWSGSAEGSDADA